MATVDSTLTPRTNWAGVPSTGAPQRRSEGVQEALGLSPDEIERRKRETGVDPGAAGYVSGQVAPGSQNPATPRTAPTPAPSAPPPATTQPPPQGALPPGAPGVGGAQPTQSSFLPPGAPGNGGAQPTGSSFLPSGSAGDTTTRSSALTAAAAGPAPQQTTTRSSALTSPAPGQTAPPPPNTGITQGSSPVPTGSSASPTVWLGEQFGIDVPDPGGDLLKTNLADLSPTQQAQAAAMGLSGNFDQERYAYRPGAAASQDVVALEKAKADQMRAAQEVALGGLRSAATGAVPSAAELQMRQEAGRNVAATLGQARALGGRSAGGAARAGTLATADILANTNVAGAQLRAAEQDRARQAEVAALSGVRGQDIDTAAKDAQLQQEAYQNNLRSQLEQNQLAEQHRQALIDAQLKALNIGTTAAGYTVAGSTKNAEAQNKFTGGLIDIGAGAFGL